jgi:hypothetical protein
MKLTHKGNTMSHHTEEEKVEFFGGQKAFTEEQNKVLNRLTFAGLFKLLNLNNPELLSSLHNNNAKINQSTAGSIFRKFISQTDASDLFHYSPEIFHASALTPAVRGTREAKAGLSESEKSERKAARSASLLEKKTAKLVSQQEKHAARSAALVEKLAQLNLNLS